MPASTLSSVETNGSLGTDDLKAVAQVIQALATKLKNTDPQASNLLQQLADQGFEIANGMASIAPNYALGAYSNDLSALPGGRNCLDIPNTLQGESTEAVISAMTDCQQYNAVILVTRLGAQLENKSANYLRLAEQAYGYTQANNLLTPQMLSLLELLSTEVYNTVLAAESNYKLYFEPNTEHIVRVDSTHIENMGLAITPATQPQPQT